MKATTIILAAILTFTANILFAGNDNASVSVLNTSNTVTMTALAPEVPAEADFNDAFIDDYTALAPVSPAEAQFEEMTYETVSALNLAPLTPATADFDETNDYTSLAPLTPAEADFE
ncbi:MAG: hypothetical protein WCO02_12870 [Bacteroidota bacterium]